MLGHKRADRCDIWLSFRNKAIQSAHSNAIRTHFGLRLVLAGWVVAATEDADVCLVEIVLILVLVAIGDQELMHVVEGERLIENVIMDAVGGLVDSCDSRDMRHWEELLVDWLRSVVGRRFRLSLQLHGGPALVLLGLLARGQGTRAIRCPDILICFLPVDLAQEHAAALRSLELDLKLLDWYITVHLLIIARALGAASSDRFPRENARALGHTRQPHVVRFDGGVLTAGHQPLRVKGASLVVQVLLAHEYVLRAGLCGYGHSALLLL